MDLQNFTLGDIDQSIQYLSQSLPKIISLSQLKLDLKHNSFINVKKPFKNLGITFSICKPIRKLNLILTGCKFLNNISHLIKAISYQPNLTHLKLNLSNTRGIKD